MKISEVLIALLIASVLAATTAAAFIAYNTPRPYRFMDDSVLGENNIIELDGQGGYEMSHWHSLHKRIFLDSGTYSDPGGNEITLTNGDGRSYKIRVWDRRSKRPQYRLSNKNTPKQ
jgi:hypothetical protein